MNNETMDTHEQLSGGLPSASSFDADFRCLGKRWLEQQCPQEKDSPAAARGTKIHDALAKSDLDGLSSSDAITASRCMFATGELVQQYSFEGAETFFEATGDMEWNAANTNTLLPRMWDAGDDFDPLWSAQLDELHVQTSGNRLLVIDYKTGFSIPQPIESNWQMRAEVCAATLTFPCDEAVAALVHPHHPDSLYEVAVFTPDAIAANLATIRHNVAAIQTPDMPRTPNPVSCQYCRAKAVCPEYQQAVGRLSEAIKSENEDKGYTAIIQRSPAERAAHLRDLKMVKSAIEAVKEQYVTLLEKDETAIPGWTLRKKWDRKVSDEAAALELVRREFGETAATHAVSFSLAELEAFLATQIGGKRKADEAVKAALHGLVTYKPSKFFLAEKKAL